MEKYLLLSSGGKDALAELVSRARSHLMISSPYATDHGVAFILDNRHPSLESITLVTDLSPGNICDGATDPSAFASVMASVPNVVLRHLPRLHAKVYISDVQSAIITSANLTIGGLRRNYEYGVRISDPSVVSSIFRDISEYSELGAPVGQDSLRIYCEIASRVRTAYQKQRNSVSRSVRSEFDRQFAAAQEQLLRLRLAEGPMHTVFAKTILYLLAHSGPLSTDQLHPRIKAIHPDLCDDTVDRIIDGKSYGKKWKHAVRSAQQQLKKKDLVRLEDERWTVTRGD